MCPKSKSMRRQLAKRSSEPTCYYCGLPFNINPLAKGEPGSRKSAARARMTLEHLDPVVNGGGTSEANCVLAHKWCNSQASTLSIFEKHRLKETLTQLVAAHSCLPWNKEHAYNPDMPRTERRPPKPPKPKIKGKKAIRESLCETYNRCVYCNMPFELVPVEDGEPYYKKFKSYARMVLIPLVPVEDGIIYDASNCLLAHQWCRNKTMHLSPEAKEAFKIAMTEKCANGDILPWISKEMLKRYLSMGGNLARFMERNIVEEES